MDLKDSETRWKTNLQKVAYASEGNAVIDAKTIEDFVAEILAEGFRAGAESAGKKEPRKQKHFRFDVPLLQKRAKAKKVKFNLEWIQVSDATGITVAPLKQHLGDKPPKEMGLGVAISLLAWIEDFDLLGYLLED